MTDQETAEADAKAKAAAKSAEELLKERGFQTVEELLADRDKAAEERDHFKEHNDKAAKIIQRQGSELGELRKQLGSKGKPQEGSNGADPSLEELEQSLTPEQKQAAEEAYAAATDVEKLTFASDPTAKRKLLMKAKAIVKSIPKSLFGTPQSGQSQEADEKRIEELFNVSKRRSTFYPAGVTGGSPNPPDNESISTVRPVGTGGVINALKRQRGEVERTP